MSILKDRLKNPNINDIVSLSILISLSIGYVAILINLIAIHFAFGPDKTFTALEMLNKILYAYFLSFSIFIMLFWRYTENNKIDEKI